MNPPNPAINPSFAIAAAHGITPRTAVTWKPDFPRTPRVMVPVQLDALVMRADGGQWADTRMKEPPTTGTPVPRLSLLPDPFQNLEGVRKRGVYLHWALPDGLTHATTSPDNSQATFPSLPDRWLVVRMFPAQDGSPRRGIRAWVLRSDEDPPVVTDLDEWVEPGSKPWSKGPFTVLGLGDPAWAAYYDNVVNRFAFYDDLSDIKTGPIAYLVCGWYSDPTQDPLGTNIHSLAGFDSTIAALGWELEQGELEEAYNRFSVAVKSAALVGLDASEAVTPVSRTLSVLPVAAVAQAPQIAGSAPAALDASGHPEGGSYQTNGAWWPSLTVYHGSAVAIGWPGVGFPGADQGLLAGETGGPPPASSIRVAFGNTVTEAISDLVALTNNSPQEARVLEAFILGALQELDQPDGAARIDARLHANAFGSLPGGETTETVTIPATGPGPTLPTEPVSSAPGIFKRPATGLTILHELPDVTTQAPSFESAKFASAERRSESLVLKGGLQDAIGAVTPATVPAGSPAHDVTVKRSLPRRFYPSDPVFLLQGAQRSYKHGGDGRFLEDGNLACRLTGFAVTELACFAATAVSPGGQPLGRPSITGDDVLLRGIENGSVPPECEDLLREAVLHDPGTAVPAALSSMPSLQGAALLAQAQNFMVEQTVWWATRDPRVDHNQIVAQSGITGTIPSPIAVTPPTQPWTPLHLDWSVQFLPSGEGISDWSLGEIDFQSDLKSLPGATDTKSGIILNGRALLTGGGARNIASSVRTALKQAASAAGSEPLTPNQVHQFHSPLAEALLTAYAGLTVSGRSTSSEGVPPVDRSALQDIAGTLENMDVLAGALDNFHTRLRGGLTGDGKTTGPTPTPFVQLRAGFLRILRLRLVDCFGQFVDLAGSGPLTIADPKQIVQTEPVQVTGRPDIAVLPPRFTSPTRLWFRFMDGSTDVQEATTDITPVCGYLLPNHLDGDLEFFDVAGANLGDVRPDPEAGILWETAPGVASTVGSSPARSIANPYLSGIAQGLLDWGLADADAAREDALSALLRIIDSTLWSVDPFGHIGDEHLSLLVGHPVAVLRARIRLEVEEPVNPDSVNQMAVPVRLGALVHWQDGLLGYFVNDDYHTLYCADASVAGFAREIGPGQGFLQPANLVDDYYQNFSNDLGANVAQGATPVTHPYVNDSGLLMIQPNQEVKLTLLVEPHSVVHATTGFTPRKEIGMRREWVSAALSKISPTFRFGPVLVDPKRLRMPVPNDIHGSWSWDHRTDITTWSADRVVRATGDAIMADDPARAQEGWLRMIPQPDSTQGGPQ
jgi:hypothetical protein